MDKNLFLLRRKEHVLLQGIDLAKPTVLGHEFEFETTRNKVDVIIVSKNRNNILNSIGNGVSAAEIDRIIENGEEEERAYEGELKDIETLIRQAIDDELRRRKDEECPEERPYLPNYDDKDGIEPHYGNWDDDYDDFPYDDDEELETWINRFEEQRRRGRELLSELGRIEKGQQISYYKSKDDIIKELNKLYPEQLLSDFENFYSDRYSNYQLKLLDDRIRQLRQKRARLHSGNALGDFTRYCDDKGKETKREIRLFLDDIEQEANWMHVDRIEIIAIVYIHELFHAYYSQRLTERHALVDSITEVEEAMAEFGMLCFMENAFPQFLTTAMQNVQNELNTTDSRHYGLGYCLYTEWGKPYFNRYLFNGDLLSIYQNIQLSIRNSRKRVSCLKQTLMKNVPNMPYPFNHNNCIKVIYDLFYLYDYLKKDNTQHHYFNGRTYSDNIKMVYAVIEYYNQRNSPNYTDLVRDFRLSHNPKDRWFEDIKNANTKKHDFGRQLTLSDGTVIVPMLYWRGGIGDNTEAFIKMVDLQHKRGILDRHVLYLG